MLMLSPPFISIASCRHYFAALTLRCRAVDVDIRCYFVDATTILVTPLCRCHTILFTMLYAAMPYLPCLYDACHARCFIATMLISHTLCRHEIRRFML